MAKVDGGDTSATAAAGTAAPPAPAAGAAPAAPDGSGRLTAAAAANTGLTDIAALTGKQPEGVTAVEPTSNGWVIAVEVVEDRHVPSSADILATYEAELGNDGTLLAYRRTRRYARARGDGGRTGR